MVRLTIRATDDSVPAPLLRLMEDRISTGFTTTSAPNTPLSHGPTVDEISDAFRNVMVT